MPDMTRNDIETVIRGGRCLIPGEGLVTADIVCSGGCIAEVRRGKSSGSSGLDASGCLVLPGIVDIHGDAFERQIMPRPKTMFPLDIAMLETDRQLAANGVTTAYHGITVSWEPGLRSLEEASRIIEALDSLEPRLRTDHRLHIRWETFALDEMVEVEALFKRAKKPLLAFNDHTTPSIAGSRADIKIRSAAERAMIDVEHYWRLLHGVAERAGEVAASIRRMAAAAASDGVPMLSHDDYLPEGRSAFRDMGVRIAEFPMNSLTLDAAAAAGDVVVLGAPNVVRGGSHNGAIGAEQAIRQEKCSVLASDYYYPAPLQAVIALEQRGALPLEKAWDMISQAPAAACGLTDRGRIEKGLRADLVILPETGSAPVATLVAGSCVYRAY
ncbi:alpha-D-ribose 1-methylphosphonate 5-triphosphate diphosphatase [Aestuariivirga sp.]|jgi:alpha-D-ribose 1-methylphosphonate 5-triphosphate diphosphatase|uniref:alpha-D-ribose 1-methylphosphonate 5-triphosphate diphosphatase n=1 Tax=Aestuariivirga sp. TaxID=2650926 RepID=UPI003784DFD8